jgi:hypothetical protein
MIIEYIKRRQAAHGDSETLKQYLIGETDPQINRFGKLWSAHEMTNYELAAVYINTITPQAWDLKHLVIAEAHSRIE